jgi:anti-sigma regulatory factor (Ser/Thr protein kinase)
MSRELAVAEAFVELSNTLVAELDVVDFLHLLTARCVQLLDVQVASVMVADEHGVLRLMAASSEYARLLELFEVEAAPCATCFATGSPVTEPDLDAADARWPQFARLAHAVGFRSVYSLPMRLRGEVIGVLSLFRSLAGPLNDGDVRIGQALANVATVGLLQHRTVAHRQVLVEQLRHVANGRVLIELARGVLAERLGVDVDAALEELRRHSARTHLRLSEAAAAVVEGDQPAGRVDAAGRLGPGLLVRRFDRGTLGQLRHLVGERLVAAGLHGSASYKLLLAIHEAAVNAVSHGGGSGRLWLWRKAGSMWCEISDDGPGMPPGFTLATGPPEAGEFGNRGLWLIKQFCADLDIGSTPAGGTRLLLGYPLPAPASADRGPGRAPGRPSPRR